MSNSTSKPTTSFWIISVLALIWNILGVVAYLGQAYMTDEVLAALPEADQSYYNNMPAWVTAAFAIAVFTGTLGCLALVFKKKLATALLLLSLIAVIVQFIYNFFIQNYMEVSGTRTIMPIVIVVFALFLVWYSKKSEANGWIS